MRAESRTTRKGFYGFRSYYSAISRLQSATPPCGTASVRRHLGPAFKRLPQVRRTEAVKIYEDGASLRSSGTLMRVLQTASMSLTQGGPDEATTFYSYGHALP